MHPDTQFHWHDRDAMRVLVADIAFGALFASIPDGPRVAHLPVTWAGDETLHFHLSRGNALARHLDGASAVFVVQGPDAYVSPDWYGLDADQVPTWNYVAVELEGRVSRLPHAELVAQIDALAADHEARLAPKPAWSRDKMDAGAFDRMTRGITGFALEVQAWRGTAKLNQDKPEAARLAAADALEAGGRRAIAHLMRHPLVAPRGRP